MVKNKYSGKKNTFFSKKTNKKIELRSLLERRFAHILEESNNVISYQYETITIPYIYEEKLRKYTPDFVTVYSDRTIMVTEVKPKFFIGTEEVTVKKDAAVSFLKKHYPLFNIKYEIITEEMIKEIEAMNGYSVKKQKRKTRKNVKKK